MRFITVVLSLWLSAFQVTHWTDCCCGSFCLRKGSCTGCQDMSIGGEGKRKADHGCRNPVIGVDPSKPCEQDSCTHLEPQGDVTSVKADYDFIPAAIFLGFVLLDPAGRGVVWVPVRRNSKSPPHAEDPPLYLRLQVLLI